MKKIIYFLLISIFTIIFPQTSFAKSTTDVRIETNGQVKTFHAEGDQNINWQSDDGNTQVHINNQSNRQSSQSLNANQQTNKVTKTSPEKNSEFINRLKSKLDHLKNLRAELLKKIFR